MGKRNGWLMRFWIDYDANYDENCDMLWWRLIVIVIMIVIVIVIVPHIDVKFMRKVALCDKVCDSEAEPGG